MSTSTALEYSDPVATPTLGKASRLRTVRAQDEHCILATLTIAFADDAPVRWLYPGADRHLRHFPDFVRAFGGGAVSLGTAYHVEAFAGCALWLPPGEQPDEERLAGVVERTIPAHRHEEVFAVFEAMGAVHPTEPHWYLPLIGVDTAAQGRGLGSALLRHTLDECDRDGVPAYLEATSPRNVALYERHGFRRLSVLRVGTCPPITPMWRKPA